MSTPINDGGPAFPLPKDIQAGMREGTFGVLYDHIGLSLRDWFAGQALEADLAPYLPQTDDERRQNKHLPVREWAKYRYADAMIAAREGTKP